jgi:hypothetical protein
MHLNFIIIISFLLYCKPKWHNKANMGRVGEFGGFPCNSEKVVFLANGNMYEVQSNTFFLSGKALYPLKALP